MVVFYGERSEGNNEDISSNQSDFIKPSFHHKEEKELDPNALYAHNNELVGSFVFVFFIEEVIGDVERAVAVQYKIKDINHPFDPAKFFHDEPSGSIADDCSDDNDEIKCKENGIIIADSLVDFKTVFNDDDKDNKPFH